uniref:Uncharacterized protein n=1 Tax=Junco hyemalis TaxID=40217 RepID=A0A8C5I913_JUNHY
MISSSCWGSAATGAPLALHQDLIFWEDGIVLGYWDPKSSDWVLSSFLVVNETALDTIPAEQEGMGTGMGVGMEMGMGMGMVMGTGPGWE